jgi:hypothetical protein
MPRCGLGVEKRAPVVGVVRPAPNGIVQEYGPSRLVDW